MILKTHRASGICIQNRYACTISFIDNMLKNCRNGIVVVCLFCQEQ